MACGGSLDMSRRPYDLPLNALDAWTQVKIPWYSAPTREG